MGSIITAVIWATRTLWARWTIWAARTVWTDWFIVDVAFSGKNPVDFTDAMHIFIAERHWDVELNCKLRTGTIYEFTKKLVLTQAIELVGSSRVDKIAAVIDFEAELAQKVMHSSRVVIGANRWIRNIVMRFGAEIDFDIIILGRSVSNFDFFG